MIGLHCFELGSIYLEIDSIDNVNYIYKTWIIWQWKGAVYLFINICLDSVNWLVNYFPTDKYISRILILDGFDIEVHY